MLAARYEGGQDALSGLQGFMLEQRAYVLQPVGRHAHRCNMCALQMQSPGRKVVVRGRGATAIRLLGGRPL